MDCKNPVVVEVRCDLLRKLRHLLLIKVFYEIARNRELESAQEAEVGGIAADEPYALPYVFRLIAKTILRDFDRRRRRRGSFSL